jgi:hypothetical protein
MTSANAEAYVEPSISDSLAILMESPVALAESKF